jgi:hypothetical protein
LLPELEAGLLAAGVLQPRVIQAEAGLEDVFLALAGGDETEAASPAG